MADTPTNSSDTTKTDTTVVTDTTKTADTTVVTDTTKAVDTTAAGDTTKTVLTTDTTDVRPAPPIEFPTDWREKLAGDDAGLANILKRYASPQAFAVAHRQLQTKLSSGELKSASPGANATPEEIANWRKDNGIPDKPEGYKDALPKGVTIGAQDEALLGEYFKTAHDANTPPGVVAATVDWYFKNMEKMQVERVNLDVKAQQVTEDKLRGEWQGPEYRRNIGIITGFLDTAPAGMKDVLLNARGPDGTPIFSTPDVVRFFLDAAMAANPAATLAPGVAAQAPARLQDRKMELEKMMGNRQSDYWRRGSTLPDEYQSIVRALTALEQQGHQKR